MFLEGNWNILSELQNYPDMVGKWDVAVLPMCPNPHERRRPGHHFQWPILRYHHDQQAPWTSSWTC